GLAGFQPGQSVALSVYRHFGQVLNVGSGQVMHEYAESIGSVKIDTRGQALLSFDTAGDDPWGRYLVVSDPPVDPLRQGQFTLGSGANPFLRSDTPPPNVAAELPFALPNPPCLGQ